jgi:hypothetical protein
MALDLAVSFLYDRHDEYIFTRLKLAAINFSSRFTDFIKYI